MAQISIPDGGDSRCAGGRDFSKLVMDNFTVVEAALNAQDLSVTALQSAVATLQSQMTGALADITTLEGQMTGALADIVTLEGQVSALEGCSPAFVADAGPAQLIGLTAEGGYAVRLLNKTGSASVKGTLVEAASGTDKAFVLADASEVMTIGVVYEDGIADGSLCWVVTQGRCQVKLQDNAAGTRYYWVRTSTSQAGRAVMLSAPPGGGIPELDAHMAEIGHSIESVNASASGALCYCMVHFN